jgi:fatty acid desaturase
MRGRPFVDLRTLAALVLEWFVITLAMILAVRTATWWAYGIAAFVISTRQHGLLMLFHDAVHGMLARSQGLNDILINLFVGVPNMLPIEVYRPLHLTHHRKLGTVDDPERKFLYAGQAWRYRPLSTTKLLLQLLGDLFVVNGARTIAAWRRAGGVLVLRPPTILSLAMWMAMMFAFMWNSPLVAGTVLLLWFVPLMTLTNLLQKLRSFAEHSGGPGVTPGWSDWTYTWRVGWLGRLTIWPYNINRHLEHHAQPNLAWHRLPQLATGTQHALEGRMLVNLLHRRILLRF